MDSSKILSVGKLGFPWQTQDPFLFCAHHADFFPKGDGSFGPDESLDGRNIGNDFVVKNGYRMYHGSKVPGFPVHPHRGFETITIAKTGLVDHADSMGAAGRFGNGDVQWMTAGKGVQHSEMFPLLNEDAENPLEIFQIWLNLPRISKFVEPYFLMLWSEAVPKVTKLDDGRKKSEITVVAGSFYETKALDPAPDSWAANADHDVAVWTIKMEAGANLVLPMASLDANRTLYFYKGETLLVEGIAVNEYQAVKVKANEYLNLSAQGSDAFILVLQGKPINEPVVQYGPFVMNTEAEIQQTYMDYQHTRFGGWPWDSNDPVHGKNIGRFAKYPDGKEERR